MSLRSAAITAAVLCPTLMLVVPVAAGDGPTRVDVKSWSVQVNGGPKQRVAPGATFTHCPGDDVDFIWIYAKMTHPSRKGAEYHAEWRHHGEVGELYTETGRNGKIELDFVSEGGGFGNGRWGIRFDLGGRHVGTSWIKLKTASGPGC